MPMTGAASTRETVREMTPPRRRRILLIHRFYWPDTPPYGHILKEIATRLAAEGHQVEVLSTQPCYKQGLDHLRQPATSLEEGVSVRRIRLRCEVGRGPLLKAWNILRYLLAVTYHALRHRRFDIVVTATTPAVFAGFAGRCAARMSGAKLIYNCMDLHPELGELSGDFSNNLLRTLLQRTENKTCRRATSIVVLSEDMRDSIVARDPKFKDKTSIINNFTVPDETDAPDPVVPERRPGVLRVIFAGNVGRFQGLETMIDAMLKLGPDASTELMVVGDGKMLGTLRERVAVLDGKTVHFIPHQPLPAARRLVQSAQLGFISLQPDIYRYAYPSKTMFYLEEGTPLLAAIEPDSELARMIRDDGIGVVVAPGDVDALTTSLRDAATQFAEGASMRAHVRSIAEARFDRTQTLDRWSKLVLDVT